MIIFAVLLLIAIIHRYPIQVPASRELDMFGRINNLYQIIAHVVVGLKFLGIHVAVFGSMDEQHQIEFQLMNALDYAGWIAIFSRLDKVPIVPKLLANTHVATGFVSLLDQSYFQQTYIKNLGTVEWDCFRALFVFLDAIVRGYYHFGVLQNF